jgi:hypothetical protein
VALKLVDHISQILLLQAAYVCHDDHETAYQALGEGVGARALAVRIGISVAILASW